jgi:hypothetical protein
MLRRNTFLGVGAALALLAGSWAVGTSLAAFSDTANNPGNSFTAAASFCASPGAQTVTADADSYVDENSPGSNFGSSLTMQIQSRGGGGGRNQRTLVHFALPPGQYCTVTSATLRLNASVFAPGRTMQAYRAAAPWGEGSVTWANQPAVTGTPASTASALGWIQFDVTTLVQAMYAGSNDGFLVRDAVESQNPASTQQFSSSEAATSHPELVITLA